MSAVLSPAETRTWRAVAAAQATGMDPALGDVMEALADVPREDVVAAVERLRRLGMLVAGPVAYDPWAAADAVSLAIAAGVSVLRDGTVYRAHLWPGESTGEPERPSVAERVVGILARRYPDRFVPDGGILILARESGASRSYTGDVVLAAGWETARRRRDRDRGRAGRAVGIGAPPPTCAPAEVAP